MPIPVCLRESSIPEKALRKSELVVVTACAAHDAQNAFRWGMGKNFKDKQALRDLYIGIDSLRNSMELLHQHLAEWVVKVLEFVPHRPFDTEEHRRNLWQSLDLDTETAEILAHELQYYFEDGKINVSTNNVGNPDVLDLIMKCLQSAWKFRRFTESRFLTAGCSCRTMLAAQLLGIHGLVDHILSATGKPSFYLGWVSTHPRR